MIQDELVRDLPKRRRTVDDYSVQMQWNLRPFSTVVPREEIEAGMRSEDGSAVLGDLEAVCGVPHRFLVGVAHYDDGIAPVGNVDEAEAGRCPDVSVSVSADGIDAPVDVLSSQVYLQ